MRKLVKDPKAFGRVAVLMGGWVSSAASRALLAGAANARAWMPGPVVVNGAAVSPRMALTEATHA